MMIVLNEQEIAELFKPISGTGGFQGLLRNLRRKLDRETSVIQLSAVNLDRIPRYAFEYGNGGWEGRLRAIFERHLGPDLRA